MITYPLTHPQKRVWYTEQMHPGTPLYNIVGTSHLKGNVHFSVLSEAIRSFIRANDGARLQMIERNGEVEQHVSEVFPESFSVIDFSQSAYPEAEWQRWVDHEARKPFELADCPLFEFVLFKINDCNSGFYFKFHHLITDGWSMSQMTNSVWQHYSAVHAQEATRNHIHQHSYLDYINREEQYIHSKRFSKDQTFWGTMFHTLPDTIIQATSKLTDGKRFTYPVSQAQSSRIREFIRHNQLSVNSFFVSLMLLYLHKIRSENDLIMGMPVMNRSGATEKSTFGMFASTMPFRFQMNTDETLTDFMQRVHKQLAQCFFHQKYPYDKLAQELELRKKGIDQLFQYCVNYYNTKLVTRDGEGQPIVTQEHYQGHQLYALQLVIKEWEESGEILLDFDYKQSDYTTSQILQTVHMFNHLISQVCSEPNQQVKDLHVLSAEAKFQMLHEFNHTAVSYPHEKTIVQLFEEQVSKTPDHIALTFHEQSMSYLQLNQKANQLSRLIQNKGIAPNEFVTIIATHSLEMVISILAVLKAGAVYVPVDPAYPLERIKYILEDSGARLVLTNRQWNSGITAGREWIDLADEAVFQGEHGNVDVSSKPDDLAYMIYTSGSTGRPKGTMIEHRSLVNYIVWANKTYVEDSSDVFALYSSIAFDLTVTSIFTPLISGNRAKIYDDDGTEFILYRILRENEATVVKLTPAHLSLLKDQPLSASRIKRYIVGGDDLKTELCSRIYDKHNGNVDIFNEYGPTEATVGCMIHRFNAQKDKRGSVPIGVPIDNVQIYVLNPDLQPVPMGAEGEIYIAGDGVARGYLNREELTKEKFIDNPYSKGSSMYKTGDNGRFIDTNLIEYMGRVDHQVKINGYRIELSEIESLLLQHPSIEEVAVIDRHYEEGSKYLCAYYVSEAELKSAQLRSYLLQILPEYMAPAHYVHVAALPLTVNGKLDRSSLPEPIKIARHNQQHIDPNDFTQSESIVLQLIRETMGSHSVYLEDNIYHLGMDSIRAIQLASKLKEHGYQIKARDILSLAVIKEITAHLETITAPANNLQAAEGYVAQTPIVSWFVYQSFLNPHYWHQSVLLDMKCDLNTEQLAQIMEALINHHDALRFNYSAEEEMLFYNPAHLSRMPDVHYVDLSACDGVDYQQQIEATATQLKQNMNLHEDLLIKACLFDPGQNERKKVLLTSHHLLVDGVSWRILLEDFLRLLKEMEQGKPLSLAFKTDSYQQWASGLAEYSRTVDDKEIAYWKSIIRHASGGGAHPENKPACPEKRTAELAEEETAALLTTAGKAYNMEPVELMISALALSYSALDESKQVELELEGHGRDERMDGVDVSRTVGWFTAMYPVLLHIDQTELPKQLLSLKEQLRQIPNNGVNYGILRYVGDQLQEELADETEKRRIRFNYLGQFDQAFNNEKFQYSTYSSGPDICPSNHLTSLFELDILIVHHRLQISLTYNKHEFAAERMENVLTRFRDTLSHVIHHCLHHEQVEFTPSDFGDTNLSQENLDLLFQ